MMNFVASIVILSIVLMISFVVGYGMELGAIMAKG